jgi:hypothetical protein
MSEPEVVNTLRFQDVKEMIDKMLQDNPGKFDGNKILRAIVDSCWKGNSKSGPKQQQNIATILYDEKTVLNVLQGFKN